MCAASRAIAAPSTFAIVRTKYTSGAANLRRRVVCTPSTPHDTDPARIGTVIPLRTPCWSSSAGGLKRVLTRRGGGGWWFVVQSA